MRTLKDARAHVLANLETGVMCPCCGQMAREYKRKLNSGMARSLIWLVRRWRETQDWVELGSEAPKWLLRSGGQLATLRHWGLVEQKPNTDEAKRSSGHWRPTKEGVRFSMNKTRISCYVYLYNNTVRGFSDEMTDIVGALDDPFSYTQLMEG